MIKKERGKPNYSVSLSTCKRLSFSALHGCLTSVFPLKDNAKVRRFLHTAITSGTKRIYRSTETSVYLAFEGEYYGRITPPPALFEYTRALASLYTSNTAVVSASSIAFATENLDHASAVKTPIPPASYRAPV